MVIGGINNAKQMRPLLSVTASWFTLVLLDNLAPATRCFGTGTRHLILGATLDAPVEHIVVLVTLTGEKVPEELAQVGVVRLVIEPQGTGIVQEDPELVGETAAEKVGRGCHLLFHDTVVLLLLCSRLQALPRQGSTKEIHEDVGKRLQIIAASLLHSQMGVDGRISGSSGQVLVLAIGDMKMGLGIPVLLRKTKVNDIDLVAALADTHEEIVRLDVTMDEIAGMDVFDTRDLIYGLATSMNGLGAHAQVGRPGEGLS
jgi:hypothetical protein